MSNRWEPIEFSKQDANFLSKGTGIPLAISKLLVSNGIIHPNEALQFLKPDFRFLHNPFLMKDMEKAVKRILKAIKNKEKILVHTDYDADGVTSTATFVEGFSLLGATVDFYAPNRFSDGYGLNPKNMEKFAKEYDLIISGDTGIRAFEAANLVAKIGHADLIVTDHHEPLEGESEKELLDLYKRKMELLTEKKKEIEEYREENPRSFEILMEEKDLLEKLINQYSFLKNDRLPNDFSEEETIEALYDLGAVPKEARIELKGHHFIALPKSHSIVNPKRLGDHYPCKSLSGAAVVFKLMQALFIEQDLELKPLLNLLDIVAVGLVADLVQQVDRKGTKYGIYNDFEVRIMTYFGLKLMNTSPKTWIKSVSDVMGIDIKKGELITSQHLGFRFGPLLNAPGRLKDPKPAIDLLLEKDPNKSLEIARELKIINTERQEQAAEYKVVSNELKQSGQEYYDYGIVVQSDNFHIGIAGLIAGKLCEEYYRPSIALSPIEKDGKLVLKGSARSIPGVSVYEVLGEVQKDIGPFEYGGHEQAAGLTLYPEQFEPFRLSFRKHCMNHSKEIFDRLYQYNAEIELDDIMKHDPAVHKQADQYPFMKFLSMLEPFGQENKEPVFRANDVVIESFTTMMEGKGYRLTFKTNYGEIKGISFSGGEEAKLGYEQDLKVSKKSIVDVLFAVNINVWDGKKSVQMMIKDIKFKSREA